MTWVPSHVTDQEFLQVVGQDHFWRKQVNERADELCGQLAASLVRAADKEVLRLSDSNSKKAQEFLAGRAEKILTATGNNQHLVYKAFLQRKQTVKVECVEKRPCRKRPGTNVGRGYEITQQEWFQKLVKEKPGHDWQWDGLNLRCGQCQLKLTHTKNRKNLQALAENECTQPTKAGARRRGPCHTCAKVTWGPPSVGLRGVWGSNVLKHQSHLAKTLTGVCVLKAP